MNNIDSLGVYNDDGSCKRCGLEANQISGAHNGVHNAMVRLTSVLTVSNDYERGLLLNLFYSN
jgi:hypothetical protein